MIQAWYTHKAILIEDYLVTRQPYVEKWYRCGARYLKEFSQRFPHFEVSKQRWLYSHDKQTTRFSL